LIFKTIINQRKQEKSFQRSVFLEQNREQNKSPFCFNIQHVKLFKEGIFSRVWYFPRQIPRYTEFPR
jgi:hypothetical protein